jgi:NAD(P)-dependent dehydrogenase (short-subunit alcohol dehydrogenase family)
MTYPSLLKVKKMKKKIAVVTGANRGMGKAVSEKLHHEGFHVIMVGRDEDALNKVSIQNRESFVADLTNESDIQKLITFVTEKYGVLDVLINNAGIFIDESNEMTDLKFKDEVMLKTMEVNTFAPYRLMKGFLPLMEKNGYGRVVNVSSGLGSFDGAAAYCLSYSVSKNALNMLTKLFASQVDGTNVKVNAICPGWVKTDMGGSSAPRTIEEGISGMVWAATLSADGPNGGFFRDGKAIDW